MYEVKDTTALFAGKNYLIIDDFQGMRSMMREMLRTFGAKNIDTAINANESLSLLEKVRYDVVLCDYNLGAGKNGLQILEEAKHRNLVGLATAWLIITAEKTSDLVFGAAEHMPDDYIIKPVNESLMKGRLEKVLAKKEVLVNVEKAVRAKQHATTIALCDKLLAAPQTNTTELLRIKTGTLMTMGQYAQAEQVFNQILSKRDIPWAKTGLGKAAFLRGDMPRAQQLFREVIRDNPAYLEAHDWLARTHETLGELDEAQQVLARSVELSPTSVIRQRNLGEMAQKRGDLDTATNAFRKTIKLGEFSIHKSPSAYLNLARVCSENGSASEALQVLKSVGQEFEEAGIRLHAKVVEGMVYAKSGDHNNAMRLSKELASLADASNDLDTGMMLEATQLFLATGNKDAADSMAQSLVKNNHENAGLLAQVGELYDQAGMHGKGEELVSKSRQEVIESNNRAVLLAKEGKLDEAIQLLREARELLPNNRRIMINLANVAVLSMRQNGGVNDELMRASRDCLARVAALDPQEKWCAQMQAALDALAG